MFEAIELGEETAVQFWNNHVEDVKRFVPEEKLLVWEVSLLCQAQYQQITIFCCSCLLFFKIDICLDLLRLSLDQFTNDSDLVKVNDKCIC